MLIWFGVALALARSRCSRSSSSLRASTTAGRATLRTSGSCSRPRWSRSGLGYAVSATARRRRDARLFLISLAFMASFGFLALHALATPDVLLGKNAGFELATPVGLVVAACSPPPPHSS